MFCTLTRICFLGAPGRLFLLLLIHQADFFFVRFELPNELNKFSGSSWKVKSPRKVFRSKKSWSVWPLYLTSNTFKHVWLWLQPPPSFSIRLDYSYCHKSRYNCEINYWLFSDFVYAICQAQLCLYSLFEYDVLVRIWLHSKRGEELCSRQEHIFNVRSHTHIHRPLDFHLQRYRDARQHSWRSLSWGKGSSDRAFPPHIQHTHAYGDTHSTLAIGVLELFMKEQDKKLQMRLCRPVLKHMDFSQQEDDALLNLCHCIHFEIKWIGRYCAPNNNAM